MRGLLAAGLGQRRLTHRNPDLRLTSIDQRGAPIPAVRGTEIERQGWTHNGHSAFAPGMALHAQRLCENTRSGILPDGDPGGPGLSVLSRARTVPSSCCCPNVGTTSSGKTIRFGL